MTHFWLRSEYRDDEFRTPITPIGARKLLDNGINVTVEESDKRAFSTNEYRSIGCEIARQGAWKSSDRKTIILGLKELEGNIVLNHRHIMFAHVFKEQKGSNKTLACFKRGGGILYDLEYLTDAEGKRVAAFGHYAGFAGAAVALNIWLAKMNMDLNSNYKFPSTTNKTEIWSILNKDLTKYVSKNNEKPGVIIIGAHGRVGKGAKELFNSLAIQTKDWDLEETSSGGPFPEILEHDIFVNCVLASADSKPFITKDLIKSTRKLLVISDVSCDPGSEYNTIPLYDQPTSFSMPYHTLIAGNKPLYITAIDNLPAMLPKESSLNFERQLLNYLIDFKDDNCGVWGRAKKVFDAKLENILM
mgnify:CR=1 FL=1